MSNDILILILFVLVLLNTFVDRYVDYKIHKEMDLIWESIRANTESLNTILDVLINKRDKPTIGDLMGIEPNEDTTYLWKDKK